MCFVESVIYSRTFKRMCAMGVRNTNYQDMFSIQGSVFEKRAGGSIPFTSLCFKRRGISICKLIIWQKIKLETSPINSTKT